MMKRFAATWKAIYSYGVVWMVRRLFYELQVRSGYHKARFRQRPWAANELAHWASPGISSDPEEYADYWQQHRRPLFFSPADRPAYVQALQQLLGGADIQALLDEALQLRCGNFHYFSSRIGQLGFPPDWHKNPFTGQGTSPTDHWSEIPMYSADTGDLKYIWEPGRFASAYTLARASWASGEDTHAETFWQIIESWQRSNPPHHGAHWRCGQETSLRLMAWCFALYAFAESPATTPERLASLVGMIAAQADRVARGHVYAYLQRNNHAISEGVGLWTVGLLFPELRHARRWRAQGRRILDYEAGRQIAADGSYVQNSFNYHRVMLQDYLWAIRLGEVGGDPLPASVYQKVQRAVDFLYQMQDDVSGQVSYYGPDDGALITPLNTCGYADFRPVLGTAYYLLNHTCLYPPGPWNEDILWLFGPEALKTPVPAVPRRSIAASNGGYYTLRSNHSFGITRCTTYRCRPSQADMLHLDLWWHGVNVACDPGSYSYFAEPPWDNSLIGTEVHNTLTIGGQDQMERGPRFMWFDWTKAELLAFKRSVAGNLECFEGQHNGYARLMPPTIHRRTIVRGGDDIWVVIDDLLGSGTQSMACQWLFPPGNYRLDLDAKCLALAFPVGNLCLYWGAWEIDDLRGDISCGSEDDAPRGWRSRYYGVREPALSFRLAGAARMPCRLLSVFVLGDETKQVILESEKVVVQNAKGLSLSLSLSDLYQSDRLCLKSASLTIAGHVETLQP